MTQHDADIVIVGAGPVGLLCGYLAHLSGMTAIVLDKSEGPLQVGRADALNARSLQLLEVAGLFDDLYPQGKPCNTSSVWANGQFVSRQSTWWEALEGCFHKHFLMIGQSYIEQALDQRLRGADSRAAVRRLSPVANVQINDRDYGCLTTLADGTQLKSKFVIGADGSRSLVREAFNIPFEVVRPEIVWAVIDGVIATDFPKVPEIIVFQAETSDVAWIPREGNIDRFYVRMDTKDFTFDQAVAKINRAMSPHTVTFDKIEWYSQFSVKEGVAERYSHQDKIFLAGDACHIHSVNGGQGLNTGLADAFNLIWKLAMTSKHGAPQSLLQTYESERQAVARSVVQTSGELVRSTKFSDTGTHATDYVKIVEKRAANITGMGIRYGDQGPKGERLQDFEVTQGERCTRVYSLLDYAKYTLLICGEITDELNVPDYVQVVQVPNNMSYKDIAILVRPDSYIESAAPLSEIGSLLDQLEIKHRVVVG